jgi:hypothetical protein
LGGAFNPTAPQAPKPFLNFDSLNKPVQAGQSWDYGAQANTAINGQVSNPYGGNAQTFQRGTGNPLSGGSVSYIPQGGVYGSNFNQAPSMMPSQFGNMNYNLPVYGNFAPYPGA